VVGEPVNLASRVESLTKEVGAVILVSSDIAARLGPTFTLGRTDQLPVKGRTQPVQVVEILPPPDGDSPPAPATAER
jgi:adenylate cyclase